MPGGGGGREDVDIVERVARLGKELVETGIVGADRVKRGARWDKVEAVDTVEVEVDRERNEGM